MEKKLIGLYVPAVQERFDILVPTDVEVAVLTRLLADGVCELCQGRFVPSRQETLSIRQSGLPFHPSRTLAEYGVEDGAQMVLV